MPNDPSARPMTDRRYHDLVRLAYLVLPGRGNRVYRLAIARRIVDRSLSRRSVRRSTHRHGGHEVKVRTRVLARAMRPGRSLRVGIGPWLRALPSRLPDRALTEASAALEPAVRAAYVLRHVEGMARYAVRDQLAAAGVGDPVAALADAEVVPPPRRPVGELLIGRPVRRRSKAPVAAAGTLTLALVAALVAVETGGAPQPVAAGRLPVTMAPADAWTRGVRTLEVWPARGDLLRDTGFIGRATAAWRRRSHPFTRPQLLFAGRMVGGATALLREGRRVARYTEPVGGGRPTVEVTSAGPNASVPLALGAGRFLVAPWTVQVTALLPRRMTLGIHGGVTDPAPGAAADAASGAARSAPGPAGVPGRAGGVAGTATGGRASGTAAGAVTAAAARAAQDRCQHGPVLELRQPDRVMTVVDLGGLNPAEVIHRSSPGIRLWDRLACVLPRPAGSIVSASLWEFWSGSLPDGGGVGRWVCGRYTFAGGRTQAASTLVDGQGGVHTTGDCGRYAGNAVAGGWWRSPRRRWHYLAAAGPGLSPRAAGAVKVTATGERSLVAEGRKGSRPPAVRVVLSGVPVR